MCRTTTSGCRHQPTCPSSSARDSGAAVVVSRQPHQGWSLLCNGVVVFEDTGALLPDGRTVEPHRYDSRVRSAA